MSLLIRLAIAACLPLCAQGIFENQTDIGTVLHPGSAQYDEGRRAYRITSSGENMWTTEDDFHYLWKQVSGDVTLTADVSILTAAGNAHRKGFLILRQSLEPDSAYADAALHGNGLTSLQSRPEKGANTYEIQSNVTAPKRLRLVKRGEYVYLWVAAEGEPFQFSGGSVRVRFTEPFYVGLGVCAHNKDDLVSAEFTNVDLALSKPTPGAPTKRYSTIETIPYPPSDRHATYAASGQISGPTWSRDAKSILFNHDGVIKRVPAGGGKAETVFAASSKRWQGALALSPEGEQLATTAGTDPRHATATLLSLDPRSASTALTKRKPSWAQGWSPDGATLIVSAEQGGKRDLYAVSPGKKKEAPLTSNAGSNDHAEFTPDGKSIYFNSDRSGTMQVWRMLPDGSAQEQVTSGDLANWYPHLSPDGRRLLVLSCDGSLPGPPKDREAQLRVITLADSRVQVIARLLIGGIGTVDSPAWSPDGKKIVFISYQFLPE